MRFSLGGLRATRSVAEGSFDLWFLGEVEKGKPLSQGAKVYPKDITLGNLPIPHYTMIISFEYSHLKLYFKGIILGGIVIFVNGILKKRFNFSMAYSCFSAPMYLGYWGSLYI